MYILKNLNSYFVKKLLVIVSFLQISTTLLVISVYIAWQCQICCGQNYTLVFIYQNQCDNLVWPSTMSELENLNLSRAATGMWCTHMQQMTELACMLCSGISQMFSSPSRLSHTPSLCPFFSSGLIDHHYSQFLLAPLLSLRMNDRAIMKRAV